MRYKKLLCFVTRAEKSMRPGGSARMSLEGQTKGPRSLLPFISPLSPVLPLLPTTSPTPCYLSTFLTFLLVFRLFNPLSYLWGSVFSPFCHTLSRPLPLCLSPVSTLPLSLPHSPPLFISLSLLCHSSLSAHWLCNGT